MSDYNWQLYGSKESIKKYNAAWEEAARGKLEIPAIVLNDYSGRHYATWVKEGIKKIETRMKWFKYTGDIVICCGKKSVTKNAGKALCIVHLGKARPMTDEDVDDACIGNAPGRIAYDLTSLRHFSFDFKFTDYAVKKNYQGIFSVRVPDFVKIIPA